jgi:hypothetical protein
VAGLLCVKIERFIVGPFKNKFYNPARASESEYGGLKLSNSTIVNLNPGYGSLAHNGAVGTANYIIRLNAPNAFYFIKISPQ